MDLIAYALREDLRGTHTIPGATKRAKPTETPIFTGGVCAIGDGSDFHIADELERGQGCIVVWPSDSRLVSLLDELPSLVRVPAPADPVHVITPYERLDGDRLRDVAAIRRLTGFEGASDSRIRAALEELDEQQAAGIVPDPLAEHARVVDLTADARGVELQSGKDGDQAGDAGATDDQAGAAGTEG